MDELQQPMDKSQQQKEIELFKNSFKEDESWQPQNKNAILASKYKHRLTRKQFWPWYILCLVLSDAVMEFFRNLFSPDNYYSYSEYLSHTQERHNYLVLFILFFIPLLCWAVWLQAGRLHDIGKSAHTTWWLIIPIIGDIYLIYLFCKPTPAIYQYNKQEVLKKGQTSSSAVLTDQSNSQKDKTYKVEESAFRKTRDRVDILKTVTIILGVVLVFLAILCPFSLKEIETKLDRTPSYQIVERSAIRTEYANCKTGFIIALSVFFLLTVVSFCLLIKSIKDFRNIKRNHQALPNGTITASSPDCLPAVNLQYPVDPKRILYLNPHQVVIPLVSAQGDVPPNKNAQILVFKNIPFIKAHFFNEGTNTYMFTNIDGKPLNVLLPCQFPKGCNIVAGDIFSQELIGFNKIEARNIYTNRLDAESINAIHIYANSCTAKNISAKTLSSPFITCENIDAKIFKTECAKLYVSCPASDIPMYTQAKQSSAEQQTKNISGTEDVPTIMRDIASSKCVIEVNTETSAPSHIKESELLAAYRAHPELQAGIDALLGIQNNEQK